MRSGQVKDPGSEERRIVINNVCLGQGEKSDDRHHDLLTVSDLSKRKERGGTPRG